MDVEVLVVADCPNEDAAVRLLQRALDDVGLNSVPVRTRTISSEQDAAELGFIGSPTVHIDGTDPFDVQGIAPGLACRTYIEHGARSGLPDLTELRQALQHHIALSSRRGGDRGPQRRR